MNESTPPRLELRHWGGITPVILIWLPSAGIMRHVIGGDAGMLFGYEEQMVYMSDARGRELMAFYAHPSTRQVDAVKIPGNVVDADMARDLRALTQRCLYDYSLTLLTHSRLHEALSLQHVIEFAANAASFCRRDEDCDGTATGHVWFMAQPGGSTPPFYIWHINLRSGAAVPPTPLRVD